MVGWALTSAGCGQGAAREGKKQAGGDGQEGQRGAFPLLPSFSHFSLLATLATACDRLRPRHLLPSGRFRNRRWDGSTAIGHVPCFRIGRQGSSAGMLPGTERLKSGKSVTGPFFPRAHSIVDPTENGKSPPTAPARCTRWETDDKSTTWSGRAEQAPSHFFSPSQPSQFLHQPGLGTSQTGNHVNYRYVNWDEARCSTRRRRLKLCWLATLRWTRRKAAGFDGAVILWLFYRLPLRSSIAREVGLSLL